MKFRKIMCVFSCVITFLASSCLLNINARYYQAVEPSVYLMLSKSNWTWSCVACTMMNKWVEIPDSFAEKYINLIAKTAGEHHLNADIKENPFRTIWAVRECISKFRTLEKLPPLNMKINHYLFEDKKIYHSEHKESETYIPKSGTNEMEPMQLLKKAKNVKQEIKNLLEKYVIDKNVPCYTVIQNKKLPGSDAMLVCGVETNDKTNEIQSIIMSNNIQVYKVSIEEFCKRCHSISTISVN